LPTSLERRIIIGLIVSTEYIQKIRPIWNISNLQSSAARRLASWCIEYYDEYEKAPFKDIEGIYTEKLKAGNLPKDLAEEIEEDILPGLSEEYAQEKQFNLDYLYAQTKKYFHERHLSLHSEEIQSLVDEGNLTEAEALAETYKGQIDIIDEGLDLGSAQALVEVDNAFNRTIQQVVTYPGALGEMWNDQFVRGGLVGFMGPEKRGKCLPEYQRVLMATGEELTVHNIFQQHRTDIVSFDEKKQQFTPSKITRFWRNGVKDVYEVKTRTGRRVQTTYNHPFLTPDGWQDLSNLSKGVFIAVPKEIPIFGTSKLNDIKIKLIAYFITKGCLREYNYGSGVNRVINFSSADPGIQKDFTHCINQMNCRATWEGIDARVTNSIANKGKRNKNYVLKMLKRYKLWNKLSYDKTIPNIVFMLPKSKLALFLRILYTCDGWVNADGSQIGFAVANENLAGQVHRLLSRFGIVSKLSFTSNDKAGCWTVSIGDSENIKRFANEISFVFSKERKMEQAVNSKPENYRSFLDKFPWKVAQRFYDETKKELGGSARIEAGSKSIRSHFHTIFTKAGSVREQIVKKAPLMRSSFLQVKDTKTGKKYFDNQILWDEIVGIDFIGRVKTFDLTIEKHHNFVAENVLVHNTFLLLEIAMRAITKKASVAFFQAGDMTESQQLKRICVYLAKKSDKIKYCQQLYIPVKDCLLSQLDLCDKDDRESDVGPLEHLHKPDDKNIWKARKRINFQELFTAYQKEPDYSPCYNCRKWKEHGAVWLKPRPPVAPLRASEAKKALSKFFQKYKRSFKLSSHVSGTLSVKGIRGILSIWEQQDGFVPDVVLVDYADLLTDETTDFRHRQNEIWKGLRGLAQERHCLVVTVTQTDADSYGRDTLRLKNFSEDKRKYAHSTAFYGLNQDSKGKEKKLGLMRINELVIREGDFSPNNQVYVMQSLQIGRPFLGSFK